MPHWKRLWHLEWLFACRNIPRGWDSMPLCQFPTCFDLLQKLIQSTVALSITRSSLIFQDFDQPRNMHLLLRCFSPKYCGKPVSLFAVKLDPPLNIQSNVTASKCQIWWTVPSYLDEILQYQLQYKEYSSSWEVTGWATHWYSTALLGAMAVPLSSGPSGSWLL